MSSLIKAIKRLKELNIQICLGVELEFYSLLPKEEFIFEDVILKDEIGKGQIEAVFQHSFNVLHVLRQVIRFRNKFKEQADFNAFLNANTPSSAIQFNVSVWQEGKNILNNNILYFVLDETSQNLSPFMPTDNCRMRLTNIEGIKKFRNSPYTFSVGGSENRTSMIRLIGDRFEHRLPSPKCLILQSFAVILNGIIKGCMQKEEIELNILYSNSFEEEIINTFNLIKILY
jgi:glutamine synthetase